MKLFTLFSNPPTALIHIGWQAISCLLMQDKQVVFEKTFTSDALLFEKQILTSSGEDLLSQVFSELKEQVGNDFVQVRISYADGLCQFTALSFD